MRNLFLVLTTLFSFTLTFGQTPTPWASFQYNLTNSAYKATVGKPLGVINGTTGQFGPIQSVDTIWTSNDTVYFKIAGTTYGSLIQVQVPDSTLWKYDSIRNTIYSHKNDSTSFLFGADTISTAGNIGIYFNAEKRAFRAGEGIWDNIGDYSTAFATGIANGLATFAIGDNTIANGDGSAVMGKQTKSNGALSLVIGQFNDTLVGAEIAISDTTPLFIVGNGTSSSNLHNAFVVRNNGTVEIDSLPNTVNGEHLLTSVNGVVSNVGLPDILKTIYITTGRTYRDSSRYCNGITIPNKIVDSIFLPNLQLSFATILLNGSMTLKYFSAPELTETQLGGINIGASPAVTKVYLGKYKKSYGSLALQSLPLVDSLILDSIQYIGGTATFNANITMKYLGLKSLISCNGNITTQGDSMLSYLDLGSLVDYGGTLVTTGCKSMTSLTLNPALKCDGTPTFTLNGCAFTQVAVDAILAALDASGTTGGTVNVSGGTSATPSAAGLVSKANLVGKGWTVTNN